MRNVFAIQLFQLKKDKVILFLTFVAFVTVAFISFYPSTVVVEMQHNASNYASQMSFLSASIAAVMVLVSVGYIMCRDFDDNTVNYEILYGYSRNAIFWTRGIISIVYAIFISLFVVAMPALVIAIIYGWGNYVTVFSFVKRCLVFIPLVLNITSLFILIAVLTKKTYLTYLVGLALGLLRMSITSDFEFPYISFFNAGMSLFYSFEFHGSMHIDKTFSISIIDTLGKGDICSIVVSSLIFSAVCLSVANSFFNRDDI